jgi:choline dehydrogenase-like flavoprotein
VCFLMNADATTSYCVIGSGPAGISAAMALVCMGHRVTMLDAGTRLETEKATIVSRLSRSKPGYWQRDDLAALRQGMSGGVKGIPLKRAYGSEYPFAPCDQNFQIDAEGTDILPSFAQGGLSSVWGAGVLPFHPDDISDWPFSPSDLDAHYRAVFSFVPCSAKRDGLEDLFPLYCNTSEGMVPSRQASRFLVDAARARERLRKRGVAIGQSRLAVSAAACERCGLCLYGCPYGLIYNSASTLSDLCKSPRFDYRPDFVVEELSESAGSVDIRGRERRGGQPRTHTANRVLLAAGVIPSASILLRSMGCYGGSLQVQDSPYFLIPLLRFRGVTGQENESLHTMAQAYILIRDERISASFVHLSVYTYNDLMVPALRAAGGVLGRTAGPVWRALAARMLICGGYLHSRHSAGFQMSIERSATGGVLVRLRGKKPTEQLKPIVAKIGAKLNKEAASLRTVALAPMVQYSNPGRGYHAGGSFPMSRERKQWTSDVEGRPFGFERVHLVDASSLPTIPATTITLGVMANAHRIATLAGRRAD